MSEIRKKVLMIVQSTYPNDTRVRREAQALVDNGFMVDVICLRRDNQTKYEIINNVTAYRILSEKNKESMTNYLILSFIFLIKAMIKSINLIRKQNYNVAQVHNLPDFLVFSTIFLKLKKIPVILDLHDLTPELFESKWGAKSKTFHKASVIIEKLSCYFADGIITTSQGFVESLRTRGIKSEKISLIVNSPSNIAKRSAPLVYIPKIEKGLRIVYHGTIAHRFGLHIPIEGMSKILKIIPDSVFHIYGAGDSSYLSYLKNIIKDYQLENNVFILGPLFQDKVIKEIQNYDIGIVPYLESNFMHLAISTKSFEYAKLGIPMVASDLKSARYYFDDNCVSFFRPGDANDFSAKIIGLATTENLREFKSKNAFNAINHINNGEVELKYVSLVSNMCNLKK